MILSHDFYRRQVQIVARELLGKLLVRQIDGQRISGIIIETEAYDGELDQACHARSGKTARTGVMYSDAGHAYVYFTYGMHWMLNCVSREIGYPAAVLIRAIHPVEGLDFIRDHRCGVTQNLWCNGPAKLTKALAINGEFNGIDLCAEDSPLFIEEGTSFSEEEIVTTPRIGIQNTPEPWLSKPWRFLVQPPRELENSLKRI